VFQGLHAHGIHRILRSTSIGWWFTYPSEKYEFVSWDDDIPNIWINKSHVPNHQPDIRLVKKFGPEGFIQRIMGLRYSSKYHWRRYALLGRVLAISHQKKNMQFCFGLEIPPHPGLLIIFQEKHRKSRCKIE